MNTFSRGLGIPKTAEERVAAHYGISLDEAVIWLQVHGESELLPARGTGLIGNGEPPQCPGCWPWLIAGGFLGTLLGATATIVLSKSK